MSGLDRCPRCKANWIGQRIPEGLLATGFYKNMEQAREAARNYGWTPDNDKRFKLEIGIYDECEDRTVAVECPQCHTRIKTT